MNSDNIEKEIQEKGLDEGPRITQERIEGKIREESYYVFPGTTTTVCCLKLANDFTVIGKSACASAQNFNAETGQKIARQDAVRQIWELEGYLLREHLATGNRAGNG